MPAQSDAAAEFHWIRRRGQESNFLDVALAYLSRCSADLQRRPAPGARLAVANAARPLGYALSTPVASYLMDRVEDDPPIFPFPVIGGDKPLNVYRLFDVLQQMTWDHLEDVVYKALDLPNMSRYVADHYGAYSRYIGVLGEAYRIPLDPRVVLTKGVVSASANLFFYGEATARLVGEYADIPIDEDSIENIFLASPVIAEIANSDPSTATGLRRAAVGCNSFCYDRDPVGFQKSPHAASFRGSIEQFQEHARSRLSTNRLLRITKSRAGSSRMRMELSVPMSDVVDPRDGLPLYTGKNRASEVIGCPALPLRSVERLTRVHAALLKPITTAIAQQERARCSAMDSLRQVSIRDSSLQSVQTF